MQTLNKSRHNVPPIGKIAKLYNSHIAIKDIAIQMKLSETSVKYYIKHYPIFFNKN